MAKSKCSGELHLRSFKNPELRERQVVLGNAANEMVINNMIN
jgi:hypothetical protein